MSRPNAYMIEINDVVAGIVVFSCNALIFFASDERVLSLDRRSFRSIGHAQRAVRSLLPGTDRKHSR